MLKCYETLGKNSIVYLIRKYLLLFKMEDVSVKVEHDEFVDVETPEIDCETLNVQSERTLVATSSQTTSDDDIGQLPEEFIGKPPKVDYDSIGEFCFESDQLALRGNNDYKNLLEAMVILEAQKAKAVKDLEKLKKMQEEALSDPLEFLDRLKRKERMNFPTPQTVYPIPIVDWGKYALGGNPSAFSRRQIARISARTAQDSHKSTKTQSSDSCGDPSSAKASEPWTANEEKRLKELMLEFPPEENETQRWEKIATCLENRTPMEVATRVHRYYISLREVGIAYPGKLPDLSSLRKHWQLPEVEENVDMNQHQTSEENLIESRFDDMDDEDITSDMQDTPEFQELLFLKKALRKKLNSNTLLQHVGYKCCRCKTEPIVGVRWHCIDCKPPFSLDFCNDCVNSKYETSLHTANHQLEKHTTKEFLDRDYMQFLGNSDYNYLDPNYMPAT